MSNIDHSASFANDLQTLQDLIVNNPDLERLESLLAQFNIFEALGAVRAELRHSDFLAYLLDPQQNHGLGDAFARRMLQSILLEQIPVDLPIQPIDLDLWDLDDLEVRREWQGIDILLLSQTHQFAVVIENKIDAGEHSEQLQRYRKIIHQQFQNWRAVFLYLTPEGDVPSDETYLSVNYGEIANTIEHFIETRESTLGPDVRVLMQHYVKMLRRHIMSESEIARLCRDIYRKHKTALDLIYQHIPDQQAALRDVLKEMITETPEMLLDHSSKSEVDFLPQTWDTSALRKGTGWRKSGRMLLFVIDNRPYHVRLLLYIGPGPLDIRQKLFDMALQHHPPFRSARPSLRRSWNSIYSKPLINQSELEDMDFEELVAKLKTEWNKFLQGDLIAMEQVLRQYGWIWEEGNP